MAQILRIRLTRHLVESVSRAAQFAIAALVIWTLAMLTIWFALSQYELVSRV